MEKVSKVLSIDIDYCLTNEDFDLVVDLFCKNLFNLKEDQVLFSQHHGDIINLIKHETNALDILNIDLHHDIFYNAKSGPADIRNNTINSANWVGWMSAHKQVKRYTWCKQPFSEDFSKELFEAFQMMYEKPLQYDVIDARNILFCSKYAVTQEISEEYLKHVPKIEIENRIKKHFFDIDFDYLFVCLSPDYTPQENYFMYNILESIKNNFFKKTK
jgi:hypothetical protein